MNSCHTRYGEHEYNLESKKKTSPTYDFSNVGCAIANIQMKTLGTYV
jgi:hypothetical protein